MDRAFRNQIPSTVADQGAVSLVYPLLLAGAGLRVLSFFFSQNAGGDAWVRAALTAKWLQQPDLRLVFLGYPPGHFWLIAALDVLVRDVTVAARLLSLLCGIGSLYLVWKLARLLYGSLAAVFSCAVLALYGLHIGYSTTSSSEVPHAFFLLLGMYFFFSYFYETERRRLWQLAVSGLCLSLAGSIRFEAWIISGSLVLIFPLLWVALRVRSGQKHSWLGPLLAFGGTAAIWPVIMMSYSWRKFGDPMYMVSDTHRRMIHVLEVSGHGIGYEMALIPIVLLITLSPLAVAAAMSSVIRFRGRPLAAAFAAVTVLFFTVQEFEILRGTTLAVARYSLTTGTLLSVMAGDGLLAIGEKLFPARPKLFRSAVLAFLSLNLILVWIASDVPNPYAERLAPVSPRLRYPSRISEIGDYLRAHIRPGDGIIIDDYNVESSLIAAAAGLPLLGGEKEYLASSNNSVGADLFIKTQHPRFLVYSDQGALRKDLELPPDCSGATVANVEFHCEFANKIYRIYQLQYPPESSEASLRNPREYSPQSNTLETQVLGFGASWLQTGIARPGKQAILRGQAAVA